VCKCYTSSFCRPTGNSKLLIATIYPLASLENIVLLNGLYNVHNFMYAGVKKTLPDTELWCVLVGEERFAFSFFMFPEAVFVNV
jgi:hypothetical protein